jgi:hypothetical protein
VPAAAVVDAVLLVFETPPATRPRRWCTLSTQVCSRPSRLHRPQGLRSSQRVLAFLQLLHAHDTRDANQPAFATTLAPREDIRPPGGGDPWRLI